MIAVAALGSPVQNIGRIDHIPPQPVGYFLAETAAHFGLVPDKIGFAQVVHPIIVPVAHRHHHRLLIHLELPLLVELQQPLPRIPKPVGPLAGIAVFLVPDELLRPQPTLLSQRQDQLEDIGMPLPINRPFLDVQDKGAGRFQHPAQLGGNGQKPLPIVIGLNPAVGSGPLVGVRRRGYYQVHGLGSNLAQLNAAIAAEQGYLGGCRRANHG